MNLSKLAASIGLIATLVLPESCSAPPTAMPSATSVRPTSMAQASATPRPTNTLEPTDTATPTLAPTPLTDELADAILETYKTTVLIQVNAELLNETAQRVQSGDLSGFEETAVILALVSLITGVDEALPQITPPELLAESWNNATDIHEQIKDIVRRWVNQEILSAQVVTEVTPILAAIEGLAESAESILADEYQFDPAELAEQREAIIELVPDVFAFTMPTLTPTP